MMLIWPRFMLRKNVRALIEPPTYTQAELDAAVRAEREAIHELLDKHDSCPCTPNAAWSEDFSDGYIIGQMDAALSWQAAIRERGE